jgi:hypothetical protein
MPVDTIASAWVRTIASSIFMWNLFQLFQPIGGVVANIFRAAG